MVAPLLTLTSSGLTTTFRAPRGPPRRRARPVRATGPAERRGGPAEREASLSALDALNLPKDGAGLDVGLAAHGVSPAGGLKGRPLAVPPLE